MPATLPKEVEPFVDPESTLNSLKRLAAAVERGDIALASLVAFAKSAGDGERPDYARTTPVPTAMLEAIRGNPGVPARQIVYKGVVDGLWTMRDAERYEANAAALSERSKESAPRRAVYLTRTRRTRPHRPRTEGMFVPKTALDVFCRPGLNDGARACLSLLLALAGRENALTTYTSSLARMLGRTTRTVRNYFVALERAGLITRRSGEHYNTVVIDVHPCCRPEPYREPRDIRAFKLARASGDTDLHLRAMRLVAASLDAHPEEFATGDRRKRISPFNRESDSTRRVPELTEALPPGMGRRAGRDGPPTSHSSLLLDPRSPFPSPHRPNLPPPWREERPGIGFGRAG